MSRNETELDWTFPYSSQRMPVLGENVVATSQPLAAQAGLRTLAAGGNAVDAALAAAIALTVVEPTNNGLGSDAFALIWDGNELAGLNASGRAPAAMTPDRYAGEEFMPGTGWGSVTIPGAVSAWRELSQRYGRVPFADLFEPAIRYARRGFLVSPVVALQWAFTAGLYAAHPEFGRVFLPAGRPPKPGESFVNPDLAASLERVAETGGEAFYRGDLAAAMAAHARATGGLLTEEDLAAHRADWVEPIAAEFAGVHLHEIPPNGQGLAALMALGILARTDVLEHAVDSPASLHLQVEAMKLALADVHRHVGDPASMEVAVDVLLAPEYLAGRAAEIDRDRAGEPRFGESAGGDTVYLCTADSEGMMVSFIQSNFLGFGSGIVVPGTGISLQNRASGFTLEEGHPNRVGPGKRPFHTIIPGFVTRSGQPVMAFGVMGGPMQPQGHVQMMLRIFGHGQNPQAAADAPRWQVCGGRDLALEPGATGEAIAGLRARGHRFRDLSPLLFGGAQLVYRLENGYVAGSDRRKDGQAVAF